MSGTSNALARARLLHLSRLSAPSDYEEFGSPKGARGGASLSETEALALLRDKAVSSITKPRSWFAPR
ncbi:hypothetical protein [Arenibacterium sp. LLYu02]|uniref:hypothetical protein n=1 Tax=Arenibacterium sp. LLYu02 TaxID=3404132 RepID=UPI003B21D634